MLPLDDNHSWTIELDSEAETDRLGEAIASVIVPNQVIGLIGDLGAGKTRLSRAVATALGVDPSLISSPTFVLIQEYQGRLPVFHFDAYRIESLDRFLALGVDDYWEAGGLCLVEWADLVLDALPRDSWFIRLRATGVESREAVLVGQGGERVADAFRKQRREV